MPLRLALLASLAFLSLMGRVSPADDGEVQEPPEPIEVAVQDREKPVSYALEISEILFDKCVGCHSSALAENGLSLEDHAALMKGGKTGPAVVPGKSGESLLFLLAAHRKAPVMPPKDEENAAPLTPKELGLLQQWIDAGAKDDTEAMLAEMEAEGGEALTLGSLPPGVQPIVAVDVSADGRLVAAGRANVVSVYEVATGHEVARLEGHKDIIQSIRFSPDGSMLAAGGYQVVKLWKVQAGPQPDRPGQAESSGGTPPVDPDVTGTEDATSTWTFFKDLGPHVFRVLSLDFSPDGTRLATGGGDPSRSGEVKIWDVAGGNTILDLPEVHSDTVFSVRFSPDGARLASAAADKLVKVVSASDGTLEASFEGHTHHVMAVDWKSDGSQLASGGADNVVKFWDVAKREQLRTSQSAGKQVTALCWIAGKPDVVGASGDRAVRIWNADNGRITRTFAGPGDFVFGVGASRDGKIIAAGGADGVLFLWDDQGKVLRKFEPDSPAPEHGG